MCLADRDASSVPSMEEKVVLKANGLGEECVKFPVDGKENEIMNVIYEDDDISPITCLSQFDDLLMEGRKLDPVTEEDMLGETHNIFISGYSLLDDVVSEVTCPGFRPHLTLHVNFFGEEASDLGGPRREMLQLALQAVSDRVFTKMPNDEDGYGLVDNPAFIDAMYRGAGIIIGLSLLQGGPSTNFLSSRLLDEVLANEHNSNTAVGQFRQGLTITGIAQLLSSFPQCKQLLLPKPTPKLTLPVLMNLFQKEFSENGSTGRQLEEKTMGFFIRYLRQVSEGQRIVILEDVLEFVTGLRAPPTLGFQPQPKIIFEPSRSFLPRAQTCTNVLILPIPTQGSETPSQDFIYNMFDYAFKNSYFGLV